MRYGAIWASGLLGMAVLSGSVDAGTRDEGSAARWARQLGNASFTVRQQAARALRAGGLASLPALEGAAASADLEIRYRARRLIEQIEQADHEERLSRFEQADAPSAGDDLLAGWKTFRAMGGDDPAVRALFVSMHRAEPRLFRLLERRADDLALRYEQRVIELQYAYARRDDRREIVANVAALLLIGSESHVALSTPAGSALYSFLGYHEFRTAFSDGATGPALRGLLGHWIAQPGGASSSLKVNLALQQGLPEGLTPALHAIRENVSDSQLQFAILAVGRFGSAAQVPVLEPLLQNETVLVVTRSNQQTTYTCEVRDVALAVLVHLTGQDPQPYGFSRLSHNAQYLFSPTSTGFTSDDQRQAALARWSAWQQTTPVRAPRP